VALQRENVEAWAKSEGISFTMWDELTQNGQVFEKINAIIEEKNQELARYETIKKFMILPQELTQEKEEITPTLKVKRKVVYEHYKNLIDGMYEKE
jgi:long-chain acyl-CoA synthetase